MILNLLRDVFHFKKLYICWKRDHYISAATNVSSRIQVEKKGKKSRCSKMAAVYYEKKEGKQWTLKNGLSRH